jgi:uncharacterized small protein (DUF1192 family)
MEMDEFLARRPGDPLGAIVTQDLDPLSVKELEGRIALLEAEIARTQAKIGAAVHHRASADQLFKR